MTDPFTLHLPLCEPDGIVRRGAMHHGKNYVCTGSAHYGGDHIRCTSSAHHAPIPNECTCGHEGMSAEWHAYICGTPQTVKADSNRFLSAVVVSLVRRMEALTAAFEKEGVDPVLISRIRAVLDGAA